MNLLTCANANTWRAWLAQNHAREREIWLVYFKKGAGKTGVAYGESVEEALCYGWVDSIIRKIDEKRYARKFTPRKPVSKWSDSNKARVATLLGDGRMTPHGMALVEAAKANGLWDAPARPDIDLEPPREFTRALAKNARAKAHFDALAPSCRDHYLAWIVTAKRAATRTKRIAESVALLERGEKLGLK